MGFILDILGMKGENVCLVYYIYKEDACLEILKQLIIFTYQVILFCT